MTPGGASGPTEQGVRGEQRSRHVRRAVPGGDPQLDRLTRGVEADDVHPGRGAGAERDHLQRVWIRRALPLGQARPTLVARWGSIRSAMASGGAGRPVGLGPAVPLEDVGVVVGEAPEAARRLVGDAVNRTTPTLKVGPTTTRMPEAAATAVSCVGRTAACDQPVVPMTRTRAPAAARGGRWAAARPRG